MSGQFRSRTTRRLLVRRGVVLGALVTLTLALALGACGHEPSAASPPSYLFVMTGRNAEFVFSTDRSDRFRMSMELGCERIDDCPPVIWFTDRPFRDSGSVSADRFVGLWTEEGSASFRSDPPNVAIEIPPARYGAGPSTVLATMRDVTLVRGVTAADSIRLVASFDVLPEETRSSIGLGDSHLAAHSDTLIDFVPPNASDVSIFIDSSNAPSTFVVAALADPEAD